MYLKTGLLLCVFWAALLHAKKSSEKENKILTCYVGTWAAYRSGDGKFTIDDIDPFACTHIIYSFFGINAEGDLTILDANLDLPDDGGQGLIKKFNDLKLINPELITLAAVGGWNAGSTNFSIVAADPVLREKFANSAFDFVGEHGFDGLDMDWEYPTLRNDLANDDRNNFNLLLQSIQELFRPCGLILTAAVAADKTRAAVIYDIPGMAEHLDFIHLMAYDLHVGSENVTGYNAALFPPAEFISEEEQELNGQAILDFWTSVAPPEKLVFGVPLYGHTFTLPNKKQRTPYSPSIGPGPAGPFSQEAGTLSYNEYCTQKKAEKWRKKFDKTQGVPYGYLNNGWISYENEKSVGLKAQMSFKYNLAGIMVWSLENDDFNGSCGDGKYPLLSAINKKLKRSKSNKK